jgi:hypothetical protein
VYDAELHARFMRGASDAFFEGFSAMWAASMAFQASLQPTFAGGAAPAARSFDPMPLEPVAAWAWAFDAFRGSSTFAAPSSGQFSFFAPPFAQFTPTAPSDPAQFWTWMVDAYWTWPAMSWSLFQGPMTMMLVSSGLPYAVAAPAAKASAGALEAADAMRLSAIKTFSYFHTDGGHASVQIFPPHPRPASGDRAQRREALRRQLRKS